MHTIVDGMNVIGATPDGWWRDRPRARRALVDTIETMVTGAAELTPRSMITIVFDGRPTDAESAGARPGGLDVRFAPGGPNAADDVIAEIVEGAPDPSEIVVVTSDSALAARVRRAGAAVEGGKTFRDRLGTGAPH